MIPVVVLCVFLTVTTSCEGLSSSVNPNTNLHASGDLGSIYPDDSLGLSSSEVDSSVGPRRLCILPSDFPEVDESLSTRLSLPIWTSPSTDASEAMTYTHALTTVPSLTGKYAVGLLPLPRSTNAAELPVKRRRESAKKSGRTPFPNNMKPLVVDWCSSQRASGESGTDLLIKAVAPCKGPFADRGGALVYDLTAGLGQDAVLIAYAQAKHVHMVERDPIIFALLQDALRRLDWEAHNAHDADDRQRANHLASRLSVEYADGAQVASKLAADDSRSTDELPDIVYLDPMFPPRRKRAAVKKNMQILHDLLGSQIVVDTEKEAQQEQQLLEAALCIAKARVVVKRPIHAASLAYTLHIKPTYQVCGATNRWDIYVKSPSSRSHDVY